MSKEVRSIIAFSDITIAEDFNARKELGDIEGLAATIKSAGLLQPLVVREGGPAKTDGQRKFFLVAGYRRYHALKLLGRTQVEVKIVKGNAQENAERNAVENSQRKDLEPLEEAQAMQKYMETFKCDQAQVAKVWGKSEPYVSQRLKLLTATPEVKKALENKAITTTHARDIASLPAAEQKEVVEKIAKKTKETGKKASSAEVKQETDKRKANNKRKVEPDYDREMVKAAKEAYEGKEMTLMSKSAVLDLMGTLIEKSQRAKSADTKQVIKGQVAALECVLGLRDSL